MNLIKEKSLNYKGLFSKLVQTTGIEPARVSPLDSKSSASTDSAMSAVLLLYKFY